MKNHVVLWILCLLIWKQSWSQSASIQDCLGAIPVCQQVYVEDQSPRGSGNQIDFDANTICLVGESNAIWYTFTVDQSGDFGFLVTPNDPLDDYDWVLFDITNAHCEDLFFNPSLAVSCNAAGTNECRGATGATGASEFSIQGPNCGASTPTINGGFSPFNDLIAVTAGNTYVLCIVNFSGSENGYTIDFGLSGDIGIFDELPPTIANLEYPVSCNGLNLTVEFSEFIQCSTISAANFSLTGTNDPYTLTLTSPNCDQQGNFAKSFTLTASPSIPFGAELTLSLITDGISEVLDLCDNAALPIDLSFGGPELTEELDLGPDTTICGNSSLRLSTDFPGTYLWSEGSTSSAIEIVDEGMYALTVTTPCGVTSDSIMVVRSEDSLPIEVLGNDTTLCNGGSITLDATTQNATYLWQDGSTMPTFIVNQPGLYTVDITNGCGTVSDEILVNGPAAIAAILTDETICPGGSITWDVTTESATYLWQDGSTEATFVAEAPGDYAVVITTPCSETTLTAQVTAVAGDLPVVALGNDTLLCPNETLPLTLDLPGATYLWQDGSTNATYVVTQPGSYSVMVSNECGTATDEITVAYADLVEVSLNDTTLCSGQSLTWDVSIPGASYLWQDGSTNATFTANMPGVYTVEINTPCEIISLSANVEESNSSLGAIDLGRDTFLCDQTTLVLMVDAPGTDLVWQDGSTGNSFTVTQPGKYSVSVISECGTISDDINIDQVGPIQIDLGGDTLLCAGQRIVLDATSPFANYYQWQDGSFDPEYQVTTPGQYTVIAGNECEEITASVSFGSCQSCEVHVPNVFSPNGDGTNDFFRTFYDCDMQSFALTIFDRWGNLVFETNSPDEVWDGKILNQFVGAGVFIYSIQIEAVENGVLKAFNLSGSITLVL